MKKKKEIAIQLNHVTKQYIVHHEKPTFSERLVTRKKKEIFTALDDINLTVYKGEKVGIIGPNGAGKTTLLKIISGITTPNKGEVTTNGKIVSLIDLEAGFHPDLTGEENIFLNGLVIGMSKKEVQGKFKEIVEFADIGKFIDAPMYTYSSGMKLRLGFAIAVHAEPDVLVLDENITAGDQEFRVKIQQKVDDFFSKEKTILIVSHQLEYIQNYSTRIILVSQHEVKEDSSNMAKIITLYRASTSCRK